MSPSPFTAVARVVKTHGTAGELSCAELEGPLSELPTGLVVWFVPPPAEGPRSGQILGVREGPKGPLLAVSGVESLEQARVLQGALLLAKTDSLAEEWLTEDLFDPRGLEVVDVDRGALGHVSDVIVTGANDVWIVTGGPFGEVLLPVIDDVVLDIDDEANTASVRLLPGLIDED